MTRQLLFRALIVALLLIPAATKPAQPFPATASPSSVVHLNVDLTSPPLSSFMGLGIEFDPYQHMPTAERWKTILQRVTWARPGFLRVMSAANDYCVGFDAAGEPIYVWDHPNAATQARLNHLLAILDFAQKNNISVFLGEWSTPFDLGIKGPDDPRWTRMIAAFVDYLVRRKHYTVIHHYIFFNEPNGPWMWKGSSPDFTAWAVGIHNLRRELDQCNLQAVLLAGPDTSDGWDWFDRSVRTLAPDFGTWEAHIYATDAQVNNGEILTRLIREKDQIFRDDPLGAQKQRFVAESGLQDGKNETFDQQPRVHNFEYGVMMADYVAQVAEAGWMGADAWDLDDAMHDNGHGGMKIWGFWDSSAGSDMTIRPWFGIWGLMSRLLPTGSSIRRVDISPSVPHLRAIASSWTSSARPEQAVMVVNDADTPRTVSLHVSPGQAISIFRFFAAEHKVDGNGLPVVGEVCKADATQAVVFHMNGRGVVFLSTSAAP